MLYNSLDILKQLYSSAEYDWNAYYLYCLRDVTKSFVFIFLHHCNAHKMICNKNLREVKRIESVCCGWRDTPAVRGVLFSNKLGNVHQERDLSGDWRQ